MASTDIQDYILQMKVYAYQKANELLNPQSFVPIEKIQQEQQQKDDKIFEQTYKAIQTIQSPLKSQKTYILGNTKDNDEYLKLLHLKIQLTEKARMYNNVENQQIQQVDQQMKELQILIRNQKEDRYKNHIPRIRLQDNLSLNSRQDKLKLLLNKSQDEIKKQLPLIQEENLYQKNQFFNTISNQKIKDTENFIPKITTKINTYQQPKDLNRSFDITLIGESYGIDPLQLKKQQLKQIRYF